MNIVIVTSLYRIKPRMGQTCHRDKIKNGDIMRQTFIQSEKQIEFEIMLNIEMEKKLAGMYLGIRTSAANNCDGCFQHLAQCGLYNLLNTNNSGKLLPSPVIISVICNMKEIAQLKFYSNSIPVF